MWWISVWMYLKHVQLPLVKYQLVHYLPLIREMVICDLYCTLLTSTLFVVTARWFDHSLYA